jgi:hypothetical protein
VIKDLVDPPIEKIEYLLFKEPGRFTYVCGININHFDDGGKRNTLCILFHEDKGYYVSFDRNLEAMWILLSPEARVDKLNHNLVQFDEELFVSEGLLCEQETVWSAVKYYVETGGKCPTLQWVLDFDLPSSASWV